MTKAVETPTAGYERTFLRTTAIALFAILAFPFVLGIVSAPSGTSFLGFPYNTDDHMVYAAWMRQAMAGHFFLDNRFTTDAQPGLTIHLYFFLLGQLARLVGITYAANLARVLLSTAFVYLLFRLIKRAGHDLYTNKLSLILALVGGGIGFAVWHDFGNAIVRTSYQWMSPITGGKLPTDIWLPEGYVFPSLLTNSLFAAALCLIAIVFSSVLNARDAESGWRPVIVGAVALGVLMNIHSYDALLVALVLVGLLVTSLARRQASALWVGKTVVIGLGALPAALWFLHVLNADSVFAARAATPTYSPDFRAIVVGYLPLLVFGYAGIARRALADAKVKPRRLVGFVLAIGVALILTGMSLHPGDGYLLSAPQWACCALLTLVALALLADESPAFNLFMAWALIGIVAIYFPGLFQRKLAMGLAIPWAVLSGLFLADAMKSLPRSTRNFVTAVSLLLFSASSIQWLLREVRLMKTKVAETTVQPVYLPADIQRILAYLNALPDHRTVVIAMPGIPAPSQTDDGNPIPDSYDEPTLADYNPILSGLTGVYTYAGHWSETPDYLERRRRSNQELFSPRATPEIQRAFLDDVKADYVLAPVPRAIAGVNPANIEMLGSVVVMGTNFELVRVGKFR